MKLPLILLVVAATMVSSCKKKFNHKIKTNGLSSVCMDCKSADSLNGFYRGLATGLSVNNQSDSLTVYLEHIYLNLGNSIDSTNMYFYVAYQYDNNPYISKDTLHLDRVNDKFEYHRSSSMSSTYGSHFDLVADKDSMNIHSWAHYWQTGFYGDYMIFHGAKVQ